MICLPVVGARSGCWRVKNIKVGLKHVLVPWMIRHIVWTVTRFHVKSNKQTSYEMHLGEKYHGDVVPFAGAVMFRDPKPQGRGKFDARWDIGVWLGKLDSSNEHVVGTPQGVKRQRAICRRRSTNQYDVVVLAKMAGVPWFPKGDRDFVYDVEEQSADASVPCPSLMPSESLMPFPQAKSDDEASHIIVRVVPDRGGAVRKCHGCARS